MILQSVCGLVKFFLSVSLLFVTEVPASAAKLVSFVFIHQCSTIQELRIESFNGLTLSLHFVQYKCVKAHLAEYLAIISQTYKRQQQPKNVLTFMKCWEKLSKATFATSFEILQISKVTFRMVLNKTL